MHLRWPGRALVCVSALAAAKVLPPRKGAVCLSSSSSSKIVVDRLRTDDVAAAAALFGRAFPLSGPHSWGRALGLTTGVDGFMASYMPKHIQNAELGCLAARVGGGGGGNDDDTDTEQKLVGALILEFYKSPGDDSKDPDWEEEDGDGDGEAKEKPDEALMFAYRAIDGIMQECKGIFKTEFKARKFPLDSKCGYVAWIAVDDVARGKGVAGTLIRDGNDILRRAGCRHAVAFTVSPEATHVFRREGYAVWGQILYKEYTIEGKRPFEVLPDELSVMVCDLTANASE